MSIEAMKLALEAVKELHRTGDTQVFDMCYAQPVIKALEEALAKQEQGEPVAWMSEDEYIVYTSKQVDGYFQHDHIPLYTHPQPRNPLTDEQIQDVVTDAVRANTLSWLGYKKDDADEYTIPVLSQSDYQFARAIEAAHGIKE